MKKETAIIAIVIVFLLGGLLGFSINRNSGPGFYNFGPMHMGYGNMPGINNGHMAGMFVSSEREFLEEMIPHHQEAVDTAKEVIERGGTTPEIKELVENIVVAQEAEISDMKRWYKDWYGEDFEADGSYHNMMSDLSSLSGEELDKVFLGDMIIHHMGAIMMARSVQFYIEHEEIEKLTSSIISSQSQEVFLMRDLLRSL